MSSEESIKNRVEADQKSLRLFSRIPENDPHDPYTIIMWSKDGCRPEVAVKTTTGSWFLMVAGVGRYHNWTEIRERLVAIETAGNFKATKFTRAGYFPYFEDDPVKLVVEHTELAVDPVNATPTVEEIRIYRQRTDRDRWEREVTLNTGEKIRRAGFQSKGSAFANASRTAEEAVRYAGRENLLSWAVTKRDGLWYYYITTDRGVYENARGFQYFRYAETVAQEKIRELGISLDATS